MAGPQLQQAPVSPSCCSSWGAPCPIGTGQHVTWGAGHWRRIWKTCCHGNGSICCMEERAMVLRHCRPGEGITGRRETPHQRPAETRRGRTQVVSSQSGAGGTQRAWLGQRLSRSELQTCRKVAAIPESARDTSSPTWQRKTGTPDS